MKAKTKKVTSYILAGVLLFSLAIAVVYFLAIGVATILQKRQLADSSLRIIATVTHVNDDFHLVRGGEGTHSISYTFTYKDSKGEIRNATRSDFELAHDDNQTYEVGTQIIISYLVANADINEPTHSLERMSASFVFMARVMSGLATAAVVYVALWRWFPQPLRYGHGIVRVSMLLGGVLATFAVGTVLGGYLVRVIESILF